jgi:hypothetical protein
VYNNDACTGVPLQVQKTYIGTCTGNNGESSFLTLVVNDDGTCGDQAVIDFDGNKCAGDSVYSADDPLYNANECIADPFNTGQWNYLGCRKVDATEIFFSGRSYINKQWNNIEETEGQAPSFPQFTTCSTTEDPTTVFIYPLDLCQQNTQTSWKNVESADGQHVLRVIYSDPGCITQGYSYILGLTGDECYNPFQYSWQSGAIADNSPAPSTAPVAEAICHWGNDCKDKPNSCEAGTYCKVFEYWSQCQENTDLPNNKCFVTNNGPYKGKHYGCKKNKDCCNPDAKCGKDKKNANYKLCHLACEHEALSVHWHLGKEPIG